tara:strand:- start:161 stop:394 length:234 start_codon:yes stop_codon:yes gene_type:complete
MRIERMAENLTNVTRVSQFTGKVNSMQLPVCHSQILNWIDGFALIQDVMPDLSPDQREFLMTGMTPLEWTNMFGEEE